MSTLLLLTRCCWKYIDCSTQEDGNWHPWYTEIWRLESVSSTTLQSAPVTKHQLRRTHLDPELRSSKDERNNKLLDQYFMEAGDALLERHDNQVKVCWCRSSKSMFWLVAPEVGSGRLLREVITAMLMMVRCRNPGRLLVLVPEVGSKRLLTESYNHYRSWLASMQMESTTNRGCGRCYGG